MKHTTKIYIAHIGVDSVTIGGSDCQRYANQASEVRHGFAVFDFKSQGELFAFLQQAVNNGWPFTDDVKSNAYRMICHLIEGKIIHGKPKSMVWDLNGSCLISSD
jgi:hypothetical protein